jgi:hypothetical protein
MKKVKNDFISFYNMTLEDDDYDTITKAVSFKKGTLLKEMNNNNVCLGLMYIRNQFLDSYYTVLSNNKIENINENLLTIISKSDSKKLEEMFHVK